MVNACERISESQVRIGTDEGQLFLFGIKSNVIRVVYTRKAAVTDVSPLEITRSDHALSISEYEDEIDICTEELCASISKSDGRIRWNSCQTGSTLLTEGARELTEIPVMLYTTGDEDPVIRRVKTVDGERNFVENLRPVEAGKAYRAKLGFSFGDGEQIHGFGQGEEGIYNYRGHVQYLYQHNMRIPVPFMLSDKGYGILVDCGSLMSFNDDERGSYIWCDTVDQLDYYFISGEKTDAIIGAFRDLTGRCALLPKWSFGYVQSKEKYSTQDELVETAERYRSLKLGLDCIVQDWKTWPADNWGCKELDKTRYPDLKNATDQLKKINVHSMVSVWPNMNYGTRDHSEMTEAGHMLNDLATYDAFDAEGRAIYWKQCERELFSGGFDSWWCDSTEPFSGPDWNGEFMREPWERFQLVGSEHKKYLGAKRANLYAVAHAKGIFENQRMAAPDQRVLNLTRSGTAGIQKYGTMLWSGDVSARWDVLRKQITESLNMGLSGMPYWTLDIGGFFVLHRNWQKRGCECDSDPSMKWFWHGDYENGLQDAGYRELYTRWFEFGCFLPMFRSHGTDVPREIWNFGTPGDMFYEALAKTIRLRYRLMPYIYTIAARVVTDHYTMMRSLLFDFPNDPIAISCSDEYMFGDDLLICPVTEPMYYGVGNVELNGEKRKRCYLPAGEDWYDMTDGQLYEGGQYVEVNAEIDHIPVFVRAGSVIPMEKAIQYADEVPATPVELHVWPAKNGCGIDQCVYYEDAGDGYEYEKGIFNRIEINYDEKSGSVEMKGNRFVFDNSIAKRGYNIVIEGSVR